MTPQSKRAAIHQIFFSPYWRAASTFWRGSSAKVSWTLVALLIVIVLLQLLVQYSLNLWNRNFFDALGARDGAMLWTQARLFVPLVAASSALGLLSVWGRMTAQRKWRESVTRDLITRWLKNGRYRRLKQIPGEHQQADARIAQDTRVATDAPIDLALGLLNSVLGAIVFVGVLWSVGGDLSINVAERTVTIPGYLVVAVIVYSASITIAMMIIGRHLTHVIQDLNQAEATFRSAANCLCDDPSLDTRSDSEETTMRNALSLGFQQVLARWKDLLRQLLGTTFVTEGNTLLAPVVGWILCIPKYLAGTMSLGELTQAAAAFVIVQAAFNWFANNYQQVADWASSVNRVGALLAALDKLAHDEGLEPVTKRAQTFP